MLIKDTGQDAVSKIGVRQQSIYTSAFIDGQVSAFEEIKKIKKTGSVVESAQISSGLFSSVTVVKDF